MAELVHLRLEHTLPELEEMERIGLFNRSEIRMIVKKRKAHEYKLRRKLKKKENFLKYIEYEMNLLSLVGRRRERLLCESKKAEIDNSIAKRINRLFRAAISRYSEDEKLWLDQIQFNKKMKWFDSISALQTQMLKVHSKTPALWIMAAKWEMEENRSPENARKLLQRGVLINPLSGILWREYFRMELMYTDLIRKRKAILEPHNLQEDDVEENDAVLNGQIADVVYDHAVEAFDDVEYALSFIQICLEFDFGKRHIDHILKDVQERFPDKEETLDALAKRPLLYIDEEIKKGKESGIKKRITLENINNEIFAKYEEAISSHPTLKMWSFYIDYILSLLSSAKESKKSKLQDSAINIMEAAAATDCLALAYYSEWVDLLFEKSNEEEALSISLSAAQKWKKVDLWFRCLTYHIQCLRSNEEIYELLEEAISSVVEKDSLTLWKLGVEWLSVCYPERLTEFFENGIKKSREICTPLKEMYLEATTIKCGIEATRSLYEKFKKMGPLSPPLVKKIVNIEKGQPSSSIKCLRKYYEDGIREFGAADVDIWLDYMRLEVEHECGEPTSYGVLYWRAKKTLNPDHLREFQTRVMELTTGCNVPSSLLLIA